MIILIKDDELDNNELENGKKDYSYVKSFIEEIQEIISTYTNIPILNFYDDKTLVSEKILESEIPYVEESDDEYTLQSDDESEEEGEEITENLDNTEDVEKEESIEEEITEDVEKEESTEEEITEEVEEEEKITEEVEKENEEENIKQKTSKKFKPKKLYQKK